ISILFMKERRNEIGILLAMGESKKHLMKQVLLEMLIICCIGNIGAMFTSKILSYQISEKMINESSYSIELSEEEKIMIDEDYTTTKVMNKYEKTLDSNNVALTCGISLVISLVSTSISVLWVFKMKPKEILLYEVL
ncbi:MAG: FtsX-like permease family protein, partial [Traorella sp.]